MDIYCGNAVQVTKNDLSPDDQYNINLLAEILHTYASDYIHEDLSYDLGYIIIGNDNIKGLETSIPENIEENESFCCKIGESTIGVDRLITSISDLLPDEIILTEIDTKVPRDLVITLLNRYLWCHKFATSGIWYYRYHN